jgi:hypothetical protein
VHVEAPAERQRHDSSVQVPFPLALMYPLALLLKKEFPYDKRLRMLVYFLYFNQWICTKRNG